MMKVAFVVSVFLVSIFSVSGSNTLLPVDDVSNIFSKFGREELTNQENDTLQDIRKILRQPENFSSGLLDEATPLRRSRCIFSKLRGNGHVTRRQQSDTHPTSTRPRPVSKEHLTIDDVSKMFSKFGRGALTNQENDTMQDILKILRQPEYFSSRLLNEATPVRRSIGCFICIGAIKVAFDDVKLGATDEQIATTITMLCYTLNIQTYKVCKGVVALNIPIITYIIKHVPEATPEAFCSLVLQNSANPDECVMNDKRFEWQVDLPDPPSSLTDSIYNDRATPINIIVLTDFHVDPTYEAFGVADCNEPTCCRKGQKHKIWSNQTMPIDDKAYEDAVVVKGKEIFLNLNGAEKIRKTEIMMKNTRTNKIKARSTPAGYWGDYRSCDTPIWALDDVIERVKETHKNIDIIYYVGDTTDHGVWETTYDLIHEMNNYTVNKIRETFGDDVLVVPTIGNHESQPCNQFAPSKIKEEKLNTTWLYEELASKWGHYLPDDAKQSLIERGDFSLLYKPGLRIISLNNNVANRGNWWLVYDPTEAKRHLDWLVQELHAAEKANERVHILTHIPPGLDDLIHTWTREYNRIVNRFSKTIAAEFNGHTHTDEFKIFYNLTDENQAINVAWNGGGATTYSNFNLNYKVITADPQTYTLERIENYVYNLTEANLHPNRRPHWFLLYDMKNNFNLEDLSAPSMDNLVHRMVTVEKPLLTLYSAYFSKVSDAQMNCNVQCQLDTICNTVVTVLWERSKCDELRSLYIQ